MNNTTSPTEIAYYRDSCVAFRKITEPFGELSNMAPGFELDVNGIIIPTSEALYQSCRFPHLPDVQRIIVEQKSPWCAKRKSRIFLKESRPDWTSVRVEIMEWVQRVKLARHFETLGELLLSTGNSPIVEESVCDGFWGTTRVGSDALVGANVLGRILTKLRTEVVEQSFDRFKYVQPPVAVADFTLYGVLVGTVLNERTSGREIASCY